MEEYIKLFFEGESLQQMITCFCNAMQKRMLLLSNSNPSSKGILHQNHHQPQQNTLNNNHTIAKVLCIMIKSSICMRLTPVGLSPMVSDITLVFPYTLMTKVQVDYLQDILQQATFNASPNTADPIKAIGYGNEIVVITTLHSQKIWNGNVTERAALPHTFCSSSSTSSSQTLKKRKKGAIISGGGIMDENLAKRKEASQLVHGGMVDQCCGGGFHLDEADVLKAFCACVFRSKVHEENALREGICNVILQMVIGEVGTTRDVLQNVSEFIRAAKQVAF